MLSPTEKKKIGIESPPQKGRVGYVIYGLF